MSESLRSVPPQTAQVIPFPKRTRGRATEDERAIRRALFPSLTSAQSRPYFMKETLIFSAGGIEIYFTGEQFDQSDFETYLRLLNIAYRTRHDFECALPACQLLRALGRSETEASGEELARILFRLCVGNVNVKKGRGEYFIRLVSDVFLDKTTSTYCIRLNEIGASTIKVLLWSALDGYERHAMRKVP